MSKKRLLPFRMLPGSWGLEGKVYDEAEAYYLLDGIELKRRLIDIHYSDDENARLRAHLRLDLSEGILTPYEHAQYVLALDGLTDDPLARLAMDLEHGRVTAYEHDVAKANLLHEDGASLSRALLDVELLHGKIDVYTHARKAGEIIYPDAGIDRDLFMAEVDREFGKLDKNGYEKQRATLLEQPWIGLLGARFDLNEGVDGVYFEFDWNDFWITFLRLNGYVGETEQQVVDQWFTDVCRSQAGLMPDDGTVQPLYPANGPFVKDNGTFFQ